MWNLTWPIHGGRTPDNNVMHAKPDLRVFLKWMIARSGSVITDDYEVQSLASVFVRISDCFFLPFDRLFFFVLRSNQTFDGYDYSRCPATRAGLIIPYVLVNVVWFHAAFVISGSLMVGLVRDSRSWSVLGLIVSVCDLLLTFSGFFV